MPELLAEWNDFSGGHWGNLGPERAKDNQWGGLNVLLDGQGNICPVTSPRSVLTSTFPTCTILGYYWASGADGYVYALAAATSTLSSTIFRFLPSATTTSSVQAVGFATATTVSSPPDWVTINNLIYMTIYGDKTYIINTATGTTTVLAGSYGKAAAGRSIAVYGERLLIGGISDARFGTVANRLVYSGDDTGNDPTVLTAWETANYVDLGPVNKQIMGLYPTRDYLLAIMEDGTSWLVTGTLGTDEVIRRYSGYEDGSGGLKNFKHNSAVVDLSQTRVWMFDHTANTVSRFNGGSYSPIKEFGFEIGDRTANTGILQLQGEIASIGLSDEILAAGVSTGLASYQSAKTFVTLFRKNGAWALTDQIQLTLANINTSNTGAAGGLIQANDRSQVLQCDNTGTATVRPTFKYWYAGDPSWEIALVQGSSTAVYPDFFTSDRTGALVSGQFELPYREFVSKKEILEAHIDGIVVEYIPHPVLTTNESLSAATSIGFTVQVVGKGVAGFSRAVGGTASGVNLSTTSTFATTISATDSITWPDTRALWFPLRLDRVTSARVRFSAIKGCRIANVKMLGKTAPARVA